MSQSKPERYYLAYLGCNKDHPIMVDQNDDLAALESILYSVSPCSNRNLHTKANEDADADEDAEWEEDDESEWSHREYELDLDEYISVYTGSQI